MAPAVLLRGGDRLYGVAADGRVAVAAALGPEPERSTSALLSGLSGGLPPEVRRWLASPAVHGIVAAPEPVVATAVRGAGATVVPLPLLDLRRARAALPDTDAAAGRAFALELARRSAALVLASPGETLISLAREEERLERALGREASVARQFLTGDSEPLARVATLSKLFRSSFEVHHRAVTDELELAAREVAPNLTDLLGARLTGRLIAAAGGLGPLARMSGSRIQLLGTRRRPTAGNGPRFGFLYRTPRLTDLPMERWGEFARSVAALAAIAARADATTRAPLGPFLRRRRDRRFEELKRRRR